MLTLVNSPSKFGIIQSGNSKVIVCLIENFNSEIFSELYSYFLIHIKDRIKKYLGTNISKVALVTEHPNKIVNLQSLFLQYIPEKGIFDINGNCGNAMIAATIFYNLKINGNRLAYYSVINMNTNKKHIISINRKSGHTLETEISFEQPQGSITKTLLPTGNLVDIVTVNERNYKVSIVDAGNPYVFINKEQLLLSESLFRSVDLPLSREYELIRKEAQNLIKINADSVFPKFSIISQSKEANSINARMISVADWHKSFALTGLVCLSTAAMIRGTVVNQNVKLVDDKNLFVNTINRKKIEIKRLNRNIFTSSLSITQTVIIKEELSCM
ncbi:PrpF domain-containing protein [Bacillus cereus]